MHALVGSSVKHRWVLIVVAILVFVGGLTQLRHARTDALPEFSPTRVEVQTEALGLSALEVEQLLTVPLERNHLNGIPFLQTIRDKKVTYDFERQMPGATKVKTSEFATHMIERMK